MRLILLALALIWPDVALADMNSPAAPIDVSAMQAQITAVANAASAAASAAAAACQPLAAIPPIETVAGAAGSGGTCRLSNSVQPRITRAGTCSLDGAGTCTMTWATAVGSAPVVLITPINTSATQPMMCNPTATPSSTSVSIKCWVVQTTTLSLAIVTSGLSLAPAVAAPAGTVVQIIAIPVTQ